MGLRRVTPSTRDVSRQSLTGDRIGLPHMQSESDARNLRCRQRTRRRANSFFFFSSRRRHTRCSRDWSSDVCSSDLDPTYILPILMGITMFAQQKMTPTTGDPRQAKMMLVMPFVFTFMFLNLPSGLEIGRASCRERV